MCFQNVLSKPSFFGLMINGLLILIFIILIIQTWKKVREEKPHIHLTLLGIFTIMVGVHALLHLGLEQTYGYNPLENTIIACPYRMGNMGKMGGMGRMRRIRFNTDSN